MSRPVEELFKDRTIMTYDAFHGPQIEYRDNAGNSYLWHGSNIGVVKGRYTVGSNLYCQIYPKNTFNPMTNKYGGKTECFPIVLTTQQAVANAPRDPFGLSSSPRTPHPLTGKIPAMFREFVDPYSRGQCRDGRIVRASKTASSTK
ncbi:MAG: hypothetical protein ACKVGZ_12895 [Alphaproteobacteria bacterium]